MKHVLKVIEDFFVYPSKLEIWVSLLSIVSGRICPGFQASDQSSGALLHQRRPCDVSWIGYRLGF